jgi:hypothetical protein
MGLRIRCLFVFAILCGVAAVAHAQTCEHDMCLTGIALTAAYCGSCVTDICAGDPYCCTQNWDSTCVAQVSSVCGLTVCTAACEHALCDEGEPLDPTCNLCAAEVCAVDPLCCNSWWDGTCVARVGVDCGNVSCTQGADLCEAAVVVDNTSPKVLMGTLAGMSNDGCATEGESCAPTNSDVWYSYTVPLLATVTHHVNTCGTQYSYGVDTVLSYYTDCPGDLINEVISNDDWEVGPGGPGPDSKACLGYFPRRLLDSALPFPILQPGTTWKVRISHFGGEPASPAGPYQVYLPEPSSALLGGVGLATVFALSRWRLRRRGRVASG